MIVDLNFNLELWVKSLKLEVTSKEEAIEQLMEMTLLDIFEKKAFFDSEMKITECEASVIE